MDSSNETAFMLPFEVDFDNHVAGYKMWMQRNWQLGIVLSVIYAVFLLVGTTMMRHRQPFELRRPLTIWSSILAIFSIVGLLRVYPEFFRSLSDKGLQYTICNSSYALGISGTWAWLFTLSKAIELGDTVFIVLRKQPLKFLHWYHHITVLIYSWHAYSEHVAAARWFVIMNFAVHSLMYSYYACRASRAVKIPSFVPLTITVMQITQMILGCMVNVLAFAAKQRGEPCQQSYENLGFSLVVYSSYFVLFAHFFYCAYLRPKSAAGKGVAGAKRELTDEQRVAKKLE